MKIGEELEKIIEGVTSKGVDSLLAKAVADVVPEFQKLEAEVEKLAAKIEEGGGTATITKEEHDALHEATEGVGTKLTETAKVVDQAIESAGASTD